jgi:MFS family permease
LQKKFYGWTLLAAMFSIYFLSSVVTYGGSIAVTQMASITEMSRAWFGAGYTVNFIAAGFGGTVAAIVAGRIGERSVIALGMAVVAVGCLVMQLAGDHPFVYILAWGVIIGGGATFATFVPMQTMIIRWFVKRRALATGIVMSSGGFAGAMASPLASQIIQNTQGNWQLVWMIWAIISVISVVIGWRWIKNKPEDVGQLPDGLDAIADLDFDQG